MWNFCWLFGAKPSPLSLLTFCLVNITSWPKLLLGKGWSSKYLFCEKYFHLNSLRILYVGTWIPFLTPPPSKSAKIALIAELKFIWYIPVLGWFKVNPWKNTMEETFQSHLIDTTIFQTKLFDVMSEFALLVSCATCSAYSAVLSRESEKIYQQKKQIFISSKWIWIIQIFALLAVLPDQHNRIVCLSSA